MIATRTLDDDDLNALRAVAGGMLDQRASSQQVRVTVERGGAFDRDLWQAASELGWCGLLVPDEYGGAAAGMSAAVVVLQCLGAHVAPVPYLSSAVLATSALASGNPQPAERWLPRLASGEAIGTVALTGRSGRVEAEGDLTARREGNGYRLEGVAGFVLDADNADVVVAAARDLAEGHPLLVAVDRHAAGVTSEALAGVDRTRHLSHLHFNGAHVAPESVVASGRPAVHLYDRLVDVAALALAADAVGAASRALDLSVDYAKQRVQFGRIIGSFQAIKHKLADMYVLIEASKATVASAAVSFDAGEARARRRVAAAGSFCRQAASKVVGDAVQTHGGIGFTWEHDCHLLLKRAKFDEVYLTDLWSQRERLLEAISSTNELRDNI
jgi:alkylation response protein AidB-like acyl-CoA dehydrogenase